MMILCAAPKRGDHLALPWYPVDFFSAKFTGLFSLAKYADSFFKFHDQGRRYAPSATTLNA